MDINTDSMVSAASAAASASQGDGPQTMALKKALDSQAAEAVGLINALPRAPALATEGSVGTRVNTYA